MLCLVFGTLLLGLALLLLGLALLRGWHNFAGLVFYVVGRGGETAQFVVGLCLHAGLDGARNDVGKNIEDTGTRSKFLAETRQDVANASQTLDAVVEARDAVVTGVSNDLTFLLHVNTG